MQKRERVAKAPNDTDIFVGSRLREVRRSKNISQKQLAEKLNLTFQQIQKYEKGINRISVGTLFDLSSALGVAPNSLLRECSKVAKLEEENETKVLSKVITSLKSFTIEEQKKVLAYMKKLIKNRVTD